MAMPWFKRVNLPTSKALIAPEPFQIEQGICRFPRWLRILVMNGKSF
jgi:hypothetical protein